MGTLLAEHGMELLERYYAALQNTRSDPSETRVHALRVRTKKLRTLLRLLHHASPDVRVPNGALRRLRTLFRAAGELREGQVCAALVGAMPEVPVVDREAYLGRLQARSASQRKALARAWSDVRTKDRKRLASYITGATAGLDRASTVRTARTFAEHELDRCRTVLEEDDPGAVLHEVRKHVKNAWHTLRAIKKVGSGKAVAARLLSTLDGLQKELGLWQDLHVLRADVQNWRGHRSARKAILAVVDEHLDNVQPALMTALRHILHALPENTSKGVTRSRARRRAVRP